MNSKTLYLVATPIGNLGDLSVRAEQVLGTVDLIAAEDTRHTAKLLSAKGLRTPMLALHQHNERRASARVLALLEEGKSVALVSDAGTPGISDPGSAVVRAALERGLPVAVVPGPSAQAVALSILGRPGCPGIFLGFLDERERRNEELTAWLRRREAVVVLYEAPHRLLSTLVWLEKTFGPVQTLLLKELTKLHEELLLGTPADLCAGLRLRERIQGEYTLAFYLGPVSESPDGVDEEAARRLFAALDRSGKLGPRDQAKVVAEFFGLTGNQAYDLLRRVRGRREDDNG